MMESLITKEFEGVAAKVLYSKAGAELPIEVLEEEHFYDTKRIAFML